MAEDISAQIANYGIPIQPDECIGDTLGKINNSFIYLGDQADLTNENLALTATSAQSQINSANTRITELSAPLVGDIVSAPWTTQTRFLSTRYNAIVPSNKGGAGTQSGLLSANGAGTVIGLGTTPLNYSSTQNVSDNSIITLGFITGKLTSEFAKLSSLNNEIVSRTAGDVANENLANTKIKIPLQTEWPSNTYTNGYVLTWDQASTKPDKWVPRPPSAPILAGAIVSDANFGTLYNQVVPEEKGGAGTINGLLKANGLGNVFRAVPSEDYLIPSDLSPLVRSASLSSYAEKTWVNAGFATIPNLTNTQKSWIKNPLIDIITENTYTSEQLADGGNSYGVFGQGIDAYTEGNVLTLIKTNLSPTGHMWISRPPVAPTLTGAITSIGGYTLNGNSGFTTAYAQVVPSSKGGAGSINGILKADGNGNVSKAQEPNDYLIKESIPKFANYLPISSLKIDESFRNNSLIKYDDFQKTWRIASPEDEPFAEVNFIYGLASQSAGWYSGCAFSERRVIAWGQLDGKGPDDHYKFSKSNSKNYVEVPHNYTYVPFHTEYDTNGNIGNNIHFFDLQTNKKARIKEVIWNWSCAMAWVTDDSKGAYATGATNERTNYTTGAVGGEDTIWVMGYHYTNAYDPLATQEQITQKTKNGYAQNQFELSQYNRTNQYIDNTTGSIGISGNGGGERKSTCGFVQVKLPGFPRIKQVTAPGHPLNGKYVKEQVVKIQCKCDPGIPNNFSSNINNVNNLPNDDPLKKRAELMNVAGTALSGVNKFNNYNLWGVLTNFGNLYVWGRSRDGCFGLGSKSAGSDLQINTPHLLNFVKVDNDVIVDAGNSILDVTQRKFAGAIADFEYTSAEFDATCLGVITLSGYDSDWPDIFPDFTPQSGIAPTPHQALYFAGDNENFQNGVGLKNSDGYYWPASTDYFVRSQKITEIAGSNQYGLCTQSQLGVNNSLTPTYISDAKKIVRSLYGGRMANGYIDMQGRLWTCGSNSNGLLGNCGYVSKNNPQYYTDRGKPEVGHYSYGSAFLYRTIEVKQIYRLISGSKTGTTAGTGSDLTTIIYDRVPEHLQEYPFRISNYPAGDIDAALASNTSEKVAGTGEIRYNSYTGIQYKGRGYFCEAKVHTWQDQAAVGTGASNIRYSINDACAVYNKKQPGQTDELGNVELINVPLNEKIAFFPGGSYVDESAAQGGNGAQTVTISNYRPRPKFVDAYFAGMNCPFLLALAEEDSSAPRLYKQYNLYACGQNGIVTLDPKQKTGEGNAWKNNHGYLGIDSEALSVPRLLPCVYKREVTEPGDTAGSLGTLVKDKVRHAKKIFCSDSNGGRNISYMSEQSSNILTFTKKRTVGSSSSRKTITWNEFFVENTDRQYTSASYANLGASAYIDDEKLAYINGFNTFNDPPDYDSISYQYFTRMPINNVEDLVLGGNLESHTYQFFRTTAGIVWGMGEGASNVLGPQNECYLPVRII